MNPVHSSEPMPAYTPDLEDQAAFLSGVGEPTTVEWEPGRTVCGEVRDIKVFHNCDFRTGAPLYLDTGKPKRKWRLLLSEGQGEDAARWIVWVKTPSKPQDVATLRGAIYKAVSTADVKGLETGGVLELTCVTKTGQKSLFAARYSPPKTPGPVPGAGAFERTAKHEGRAFDLPGDPAFGPETGLPMVADGGESPAF
ncbi:hypothetical protein ACH427_29040 [Streptomyces sp. NPDC020379]|uniref:hypothetical protein n=1 Tax=Streptomyces sp. NPDC020379 TaxID=3365071 RepID=UPI00378D9B48